jgi:hypothetical protein
MCLVRGVIHNKEENLKSKRHPEALLLLTTLTLTGMKCQIYWRRRYRRKTE